MCWILSSSHMWAPPQCIRPFGIYAQTQICLFWDKQAEHGGSSIPFHGELSFLCRQCVHVWTYFICICLVLVASVFAWTYWLYVCMESWCAYVHTAASMTQLGSVWSNQTFRDFISEQHVCFRGQPGDPIKSRMRSPWWMDMLFG